MEQYPQLQNQKITYLNQNQNNTNELTSTLIYESLILQVREKDEDGYFKEEVKLRKEYISYLNIFSFILFLRRIFMILRTICILLADETPVLVYYL